MASKPVASAVQRKGRGATVSPDGRYQDWCRESVDDGWEDHEGELSALVTTLGIDRARSIISYNRSPDVPFDRSINPYRGCEHGCVYCFARPTHAYLDLSPGLDFESRLFYKPDAPELLARELAQPSYRCATLALGSNTDCYQPVERKLQLTRRLLEILLACQHPVAVVTKSSLVERDLDLLAEAAQRRQAAVAISVTTLDRVLARRMEPRAAAPSRRLETIRRLSEAGIPVTVLFSPVIPMLNDGEMEQVLAAAREAGAVSAQYILLRLPHELKELVSEWLQQHYPERAQRILSRLRDSRGGELYRPGFGDRMSGSGDYAGLIRQRFMLATRKLGFTGSPALDAAAFQAPLLPGMQASLF